MANVTMNVQTDSELMEKFQSVLSKWGMSIDFAVNHYMREIVLNNDDDYDVSLLPYMTTTKTLEADLREAREERRNGVRYISLEEAMARIDRVIARAEERHS